MSFKLGLVTFLACLFTFLFNGDLEFFTVSKPLSISSSEIVFTANSPDIFLQDKDSKHYKLKSSKATMRSRQGSYTVQMLKDVHFQQSKDSEHFHIFSEELEFSWSDEKENSFASESIKELFFRSQVLVEKDEFYLKTIKLDYNKKRQEVTSPSQSTLFSQNGISQSLRGFIWDLENDIVRMKGPIDGLSQ